MFVGLWPIGRGMRSDECFYKHSIRDQRFHFRLNAQQMAHAPTRKKLLVSRRRAALSGFGLEDSEWAVGQQAPTPHTPAPHTRLSNPWMEATMLDMGAGGNFMTNALLAQYPDSNGWRF